MLEDASEEILAELLETGMGEGHVEVDALEQGVDLDGGRGSSSGKTPFADLWE